MAQSTLVEGARKLANRFEELVNKVPTPKSKSDEKKVDTSWHDKQVAEANKSFAKQDAAPKTAERRKVGGAAKDRTVAKNTPKAAPRKASTKRTGY
jgi:hypothetical protein